MGSGKPQIGLLIGVGKPKSGAPDDDPEDMMGGGKRMAAQALMRAIKDDDPDAFADAFSTMVEYCDDEYGKDEGSEEAVGEA